MPQNFDLVLLLLQQYSRFVVQIRDLYCIYMSLVVIRKLGLYLLPSLGLCFLFRGYLNYK